MRPPIPVCQRQPRNAVQAVGAWLVCATVWWCGHGGQQYPNKNNDEERRGL
jgi:hypothetical protein